MRPTELAAGVFLDEDEIMKLHQAREVVNPYLPLPDRQEVDGILPDTKAILRAHRHLLKIIRDKKAQTPVMELKLSLPQIAMANLILLAAVEIYEWKQADEQKILDCMIMQDELAKNIGLTLGLRTIDYEGEAPPEADI